jgi:hypothetical protein
VGKGISRTGGGYARPSCHARPVGREEEREVRAEAFRASVRYRLGARIAPAITWNTRTTLLTFLTFEPVLLAAAAAGLRIERWLYSDADETALEACQANWRPAVRKLAAGPREEPSVAESLAAYIRHILPMERAPGTREKYLTHRRTILTWAVLKGALPRLVPGPMSDDLLRAFLWDALAFEASLSVLRKTINAVLAWHDRLRLEPPLSGKRVYKRLIHSLSRFQGVPRRIFFPIYAGAVKRLLSLKLPGNPACQGVRRLHAPPHRTAQLTGRRHLNGHSDVLSLCRGGWFAGLRPLATVRRAGRLSTLQGRGGRERQDPEERPVSAGPPAPPRGASQPGA